MTSTETYIAFAAIMLVIALLAVAIDWFGKPLRHRRFVPKMYRFPEERVPRAAYVRSQPKAAPAALRMPPRAMSNPGSGPLDPRTGQVAVPAWPAIDAFQDLIDDGRPLGEAWAEPSGDAGPDDDESDMASPPPDTDAGIDPELVIDAAADAAPRGSGWTVGQNVLNLTDEGVEPSPAVVRTRYWQNLGATPGAAMFGAGNLERLREGKPPVRRNPRTNRTETMRLPTASPADGGRRAPTPAWPGDGLDPFADDG